MDLGISKCEWVCVRCVNVGGVVKARPARDEVFLQTSDNEKGPRIAV